MASPELAIARAALSAALFKADPVSLARQDVAELSPRLDAVIAQCSRQNVQSCKRWIVTNVASSPARCASLARYLAALSKSFAADDAARPSLRRKRLHILYLLSDVLHHAVVRDGSRVCADAWAVPIVPLLASAATFEKCPKHKAKLENLVSIWSDKQYFPPVVIEQLRAAIASNGSVTAATTFTSEAASATFQIAKDVPYILPSSHGDSSTPWYDLPVGTWLPHLTPNSTRPMLPDRIQPIQLSSGAADARLIDAVKKLVHSAERIYSGEATPVDDVVEDVNELGERVIIDEVTGDVIGGDTYYGWSRPFCEKMKERLKQQKSNPNARRRSPSYSRSPSRSRSRSRSSSRSRRSASFSPSRKRPRRDSFDSDRSRSRSRTPPPRHDVNRSRPGNYPTYQPQPSHQDNFGSVPPPPPAGYNGQWPPPPPPGGMPPNWTPDPAMVSQMMAAWSSMQAGVPPPFPPPPPGQYSPQQGQYPHQGQYPQQGQYQHQDQGHQRNPQDWRGGYQNNNNYRGRGFHRGRGR